MVDAGILWPGREGKVRIIILAPTSSAEANLFAGAKNTAMVKTVREISTLDEPSPEQVNAAFQSGQMIAADYLPAIMKFCCPPARPQKTMGHESGDPIYCCCRDTRR